MTNALHCLCERRPNSSDQFVDRIYPILTYSFWISLYIFMIYGIGSFQRLYSSLSKIWLRAQDNAEWNAPQHWRELTSRVSSDSMPRSMRCMRWTLQQCARGDIISVHRPVSSVFRAAPVAGGRRQLVEALRARVALPATDGTCWCYW